MIHYKNMYINRYHKCRWTSLRVDSQTFLIFPVVKFHTSINPSTDPVTRYWPSGEKREHSTWDFWPNYKKQNKKVSDKFIFCHCWGQKLVSVPWCVWPAVWGIAPPLHPSQLLYLWTNQWSSQEAEDPDAAATSETSERETKYTNISCNCQISVR